MLILGLCGGGVKLGVMEYEARVIGNRAVFTVYNIV